jgi:hypothetical protein
MERGCDVHLDEKLMRSVMQYREKLQAYSQTVAQQLFAERAAHLQLEESAYQDILVQCALSGRVSWLRLQQRRGAGTPEGLRSLLGDEFAAGSHILVTNIRPGRALVSPAALQMLHASDHSSMKVSCSGVSDASAVTPVRTSGEIGSPTKGAACAGEVSVLDDRGPRHFPALRHLADPTLEAAPLAGAEVDFSFAVLDWHMAEAEAATAAAAEEITVFGFDGERHGVVFSYPVPTELVAKVPWLVKGALVRVTAAVVVHVDAFNDILRVARGDRTEVAVLSDSSSSPGDSTGLPQRVRGAVSATRKRPYSVPLVTPGTAKKSRTSSTSASGKGGAKIDLAMTPGEPAAPIVHFVTPGPSMFPTGSSSEGALKAEAIVHFVTPGPSMFLTGSSSEGALKAEAIVHFVTPGPSMFPTGSSSEGALKAEASSAQVQSSLEALLVELAWVKEDEVRRYAALRDSLGCFVPSNQMHDLERCDRLILPAARLQEAAANATRIDVQRALGQSGEAPVRMLTLTDTATGAEKGVMADSRLLAYLLRRAETAANTVKFPLSPTENAAEVGLDALGGRVLRVVLSQCYHHVQVPCAPHPVGKLTEGQVGTEAPVLEEEGDCECATATPSEVKLYWKLVWLSPAEENTFQQTSH